MFILAQANTAETTGFLVGYYVGQFIGVLLLAVIISALFHVIALVTKNASLRFGKVFPFAFGILLIIAVINILRSVLGI